MEIYNGLPRRGVGNLEGRKMETQAKEIQELKKGDLFYTSWGYDQTNCDYITVLEISKTGKTAKCQRTHSLHMGTSGTSNVQEPIFCPFGDIFTLRVKRFSWHPEEINLVGSYPFCENGSMQSKRLDTFSKVETGEQFYETDLRFGH